ncbi:Metal-dependent phosphohydrolase HD sub domain protein [Pseudodesulfovibrio profundus]|uniref:Metal-dependent phosphohydrolase HD sub domain protein n=1 Tax=Pseudodesulfovibrio profundus TaxID=57320 RepID=A0A2C8F3S7_9BACT|nr:HD domain-containing protein [Pseudodesulfovibrio profundus]SOB57066.1 Metal-dependent phosphohydrolase HD sub domain protein [Pseudodesulfovibrio profundus]
MSLAEHVETLTAFAESHYTGTDEQDAMLRLKLGHSMRVLECAESIMAGECIDGHLNQLCQLAALYHDIGRFPQFVEYGTFNDRISTNHARLGVQTLRNLPLPGELSSRDWRTIRLAIAQHNLKELSKTLPTKYETIVKLVRDADKLDILNVMVDHFTSDSPDPDVVHGYEDIPGQYSATIYNDVMNGRTADYRNINCTNDFKLLILGWIYDFNFTTSLNLVTSRNYLKIIISLLPSTPEIQTLESSIFKFMHYKGIAPS